MRSLTIGQLGQRAGVGVETVRFYEREGLIADPPRRPGRLLRVLFVRHGEVPSDPGWGNVQRREVIV